MGPTEHTPHRPESWLYCAEVHQATGMITEQAGVTATVALTRLRAAAVAADRPLVDLALDVWARRLRFAPNDSHDG